MPSPFPGMDPYLEGPEWEDFHSRINNEMANRLFPQVRPKYVARVERRVYVDRPGENDSGGYRIGDVGISRGADRSEPYRAGGTATAVAVPSIRELPAATQLLERREAYLTVRALPGMEIVTVIETLSPANKRPGRGREIYLEKRNEVIASETSLVELDLLRGGRRLAVRGSLPGGDHFTLVSPGYARPRCEVFAWDLRDRSPVIPVPLLEADGPTPLDLQAVLDAVYDFAGYELTLPYDRPPTPPLDEDDAEWAEELLKSRR